jgi:hypothetical protein
VPRAQVTPELCDPRAKNFEQKKKR